MDAILCPNWLALTSTHSLLPLGCVQSAAQLPLTRRSYWLLGEEEEGLVLVHYLHSAKKGRQRVQPRAARRAQASFGTITCLFCKLSVVLSALVAAL